MIIKEMTATFGRLNQSRLELKDGLNLIHAPNEGGKSTWCGFLKSMFYGIPTRDRDKKGYLADKNRYQPWSGAPMEGELRLVWQGRDIALRRFTKGSIPFGGFSAVYTGTEEPVPGLTGDNCGTTLLGVGREVWERSAFVGQSPTLAIDGTPELERRIAALFSSGEEEVSFSQAERLLRDWQNRRQHNKTGIIPRLEQELGEVNATLTRMEAANGRIVRAQADCLSLRTQKTELEEELHIHRRLAQRALNQRYAQAMEEFRQAKSELEQLQQDQNRHGPLPHRDLLKQAQGELQHLHVLEEELRLADQETARASQLWHEAQEHSFDPCFPNMTGEQAAEQAARDFSRTQTLLEQESRTHKQRPLLFLPGLILGLSQVVAGLLIRQSLFPFLFGGLGLFGFMTIVLLTRHNRTIRTLQGELQQVLQRYGAQEPEDITALAADYRRRAEAARLAGEECRRARTVQAERQTRLSGAQAKLLSFVRTFAPDTYDLSDCSVALSRALGLEDHLREHAGRLELIRRRCEDLQAQGAQEFDTLEMLWPPQRTPEETQNKLHQVSAALSSAENQLAMAQGELLSLGNPSELDVRRENLEDQLERRRQEHDALTVALDALRQANAQLQERFAPELNRRSGQILSDLTGGRYRALSLNREFDASAVSRDGLLPRDSIALSRGTADQIYLAVRLAVCQLCLPGDDPSPIVLDDALLTFDDERMALALNHLAGLDRQVLLFSCHRREEQYLEGHKNVNLCQLY